jgi:capsular polysaccharide export protein
LAAKRTILFLQGPSSIFWRELAAAFEAKGHVALKINFCFADQLYWRRPRSFNYRGRFKNWKDYLIAFAREKNISDIVYYADRFPYHVVAAEVASALGIPTFVIENGYLRPDWITLEREGMSGYSHFPSDPKTMFEIASHMPEPDLTTRFPHTAAQETFNEVFFHLSAYFVRYLFPFYRSDKYYDPMIDYLSGWRRQRKLSRLGGEADTVIADLHRSGRAFHLVALQTQGDYQIRDNSPYRHIGDMIDQIIASFAAHALGGATLVFKIHPHDNGIERWPRRIEQMAAMKGIGDRVVTIDGGDLDRLLTAARGTIVINSTVGLQALRVSCPVKALGLAIYDMPGLTHQGPLDTFWSAPALVDARLAAAFLRALAGAVQVKGSFYNPAGRQRAIDEIVDRIEAGQVNEPGAFEAVPPRLAGARPCTN